MDLNYPEEAESFRKEIRAWLEENLPEGWFDEGFEMTPEERTAFNDAWPQKLFDGGWICASWPTEYGGKGLSILENVVLNEEFARAKAPMRADFFGDTLVGPTILQWGTEEQKQFFLPKILKGQIAWCQGFSEPEAGSDLASLKTKADLDGEEWVITGQKGGPRRRSTPTTVVLARTDPVGLEAQGHLLPARAHEAGRHRGAAHRAARRLGRIQRGLLREGALPRRTTVVGGVNNGWKVAMTTLGFERGIVGHHRLPPLEQEYTTMVEKARANGRIKDPLIRQRLMRQWTEDADHADQRPAHPHRRRCTTEGPRHRRARGHQQDVLVRDAPHDDGAGHRHPRDGGQILTGGPGEEFVPGMGEATRPRDYPVSALQAAFFFSRSETIWGGTAEIQRNIVGERILGLPQEPKATTE